MKTDADDERLTLINRGLAEAVLMIEGLRAPKGKALQERASQLMKKLKMWEKVPPTRIERAAMVNSVLELNLDALKQRRE